MNKMKFSFLTFGLLLSSGLVLNAQTTCDETPNVGQIVGKCYTYNGQHGDYVSCSVDNPGSTICYFNPNEEESGG